MRSFVWLGLGVLLFLAWAISYFVFHVAGVPIHLLSRDRKWNVWTSGTDYVRSESRKSFLREKLKNEPD